MMLIHCPECGPRNENEFHYGGQAHVPYPADGGASLSDQEWAEYLFFRDNPKGAVRRALGALRRLPPLVQRRPGHGDLRVPGRLPGWVSHGQTCLRCHGLRSDTALAHA